MAYWLNMRNAVVFLVILGAQLFSGEAVAQTNARIATFEGFLIDLSEGSAAGSFELTSSDFHEGHFFALDYSQTKIDGRTVAKARDVLGHYVRVVAIREMSNIGERLTAVSITSIGNKHLVVADDRKPTR